MSKRAAAEGLEALLGIPGLRDVVGLGLEGDGQELPGILVVLHEEDAALA